MVTAKLLTEIARSQIGHGLFWPFVARLRALCADEVPFPTALPFLFPTALPIALPLALPSAFPLYFPVHGPPLPFPLGLQQTTRECTSG